MQTARTQRRRYLVRPRFQIRIVLAFLSAACVGTLVQVLMLAHSLSSLAESVPGEGDAIIGQMPIILRDQVLLTFLVMAPLMLAVGILETFRLVGPLYRMESYLRAVVSGERPGPCRIRRGDDLQELCDLINQATQPQPDGPRAGGPREGEDAADLDGAPSLVQQPKAEPTRRTG